jgi:hypothetical protein
MSGVEGLAGAFFSMILIYLDVTKIFDEHKKNATFGRVRVFAFVTMGRGR